MRVVVHSLGPFNSSNRCTRLFVFFIITISNMNTKEQLQQIGNDAICDAEWHRDKDKFLERILSKDLVFRRASGDIVDKGTYLNGLADKNNTYTHLENLAVTIGFNNEENIAIAIVIVKSAGTRGADSNHFRCLQKCPVFL